MVCRKKMVMRRWQSTTETCEDTCVLWVVLRSPRKEETRVVSGQIIAARAREMREKPRGDW